MIKPRRLRITGLSSRSGCKGDLDHNWLNEVWITSNVDGTAATRDIASTATGLMFWLDWDFTLIAVAFIPVLLLFVFNLKKAVKEANSHVGHLPSMPGIFPDYSAQDPYR
jgi:hypothetical protein